MTMLLGIAKIVTYDLDVTVRWESLFVGWLVNVPATC